MHRSEKSSYTSTDFHQWHAAGNLVLSPKFQRRGVWTNPARSNLIETILLGLPVPPIYLRVTQSEGLDRTIREVIDGQQRLSSVIDYLNDKYALSKSIDHKAKGKKYSKLSEEDRLAVAQFAFTCEVFYGVSDDFVLRIFSRLNTHSVKLNGQELRNGKYFGYFKRCAYRLGHQHLEFWRSNKIFTEMRIARMSEVELVSELMALMLEGFQDKKTELDAFYDEYDDAFPKQKTIERQLKQVFDVISESMDGELSSTEFRRVPIFYSLFAAIFHRLHGVPEFELRRKKTGALSAAERDSIYEGVHELSEILAQNKLEGTSPRKYQRFVNACLRQTDNIIPREDRTKTIYETIF